MTTLKGSFISVWDYSTVQTEGSLDIKTGEVTAKSVSVNNSCGSLVREYFEDKDGKDYEVCQECHEYILKNVVMVPDMTGKGLHEEELCSNPDCESHER